MAVRASPWLWKPGKTDLLTVAQALEQILTASEPLSPRELPLLEALGRRLAQPLLAPEALPAFASSAMDGYALGVPQGEDWEVVDSLAAGQVPKRPLAPGQAARIFTGALLPQGCWSVVAQEDCQVRDTQLAWTDARAGLHMRPAGEQCRVGERMLEAGQILRSSHLGLAAMLGQPRLHCWPSPRVAILCSGDELVEIEARPGPAQVRNSNSLALQAQVLACGGQPLAFPLLPDDPALIRQALRQALDEADVVLTCGGASVGEHDHVQRVLADMGARIDLWRVAMRPGKPLGFARLGGKSLVALPGNPVSAYVTFELFVRPLLDRLQGGAGEGLRRVQRVLGEDVSKKVGLRFFHRCRLEDHQVLLAGPQGSHLFASVASSDGLLELEESLESLPRGAPVPVLLWPWVGKVGTD